jgi:hypothetical protein
VLSGEDAREGPVSLEQALDALIGSEAFERLLLERARPLVARADAGEDALVAALARSLGAPVLLVAPGPHEADRAGSLCSCRLPVRRILDHISDNT